MKSIFFHSLFIAVLICLFLTSPVLAHGEPTITVQPMIASPGSQVTIVGSDMEDGEVFKLTLEGTAGVFELGEVTAKQDGEEAGFTDTVALPADLSAGSYLIRAATDEGETTTADLTIGASTEQMGNAQSMEASAEPLVLDRSKSPLVVSSVLVLAFLSAGAGVWLVRKSH